MSERVRYMNTPADFKKLGIDPDHIQTWEDGRRSNSDVGHNEIWYFDGIMDDGSKFMCGFRPKDAMKLNASGDTPNVNIMITTPDGATKADFLYYSADESHFGTDKCDVKMGSNAAVGDFKEYDVHIEPVHGVGLDLHFKALVDPFRQGHTGEIALGNNDEYYYTDMSVVKNEVTGTLTYDGEEHQVTGSGYHDHQWMNINPMQAWHHWLWGHLYTDKYTVLIYDFVANERFGFTRAPFFGIAENETGEYFYMTDGNVKLASDLEKNATGKLFPKTSHYVFQNKDDSKRVDFTITWQDELETRDIYGDANSQQKAAYDKMGINPVYMRYYAHGELKITDGNHVDQSEGDMIYEYPNFAPFDERAGM